jgi:hypothetical protein
MTQPFRRDPFTVVEMPGGSSDAENRQCHDPGAAGCAEVSGSSVNKAQGISVNTLFFAPEIEFCWRCRRVRLFCPSRRI